MRRAGAANTWNYFLPRNLLKVIYVSPWSHHYPEKHIILVLKGVLQHQNRPIHGLLHRILEFHRGDLRGHPKGKSGANLAGHLLQLTTCTQTCKHTPTSNVALLLFLNFTLLCKISFKKGLCCQEKYIDSGSIPLFHK